MIFISRILSTRLHCYFSPRSNDLYNYVIEFANKVSTRVTSFLYVLLESQTSLEKVPKGPCDQLHAGKSNPDAILYLGSIDPISCSSVHAANRRSVMRKLEMNHILVEDQH